MQAVAQTMAAPGGQPGGPGGPKGPGRPPPGFEIVPGFFELLRFVGSFLAIGAVGFRFGIVRQIRGMSDEAKAILRSDNAAMLGIAGIILIALSAVGGPYVDSITNHKTLAQSLSRNMPPFEFKITMLTLALIGFVLVRAASS